MALSAITPAAITPAVINSESVVMAMKGLRLRLFRSRLGCGKASLVDWAWDFVLAGLGFCQFK